LPVSAKSSTHAPHCPCCSNVKVERTADGWIALTGTDLDRFVTMRLEHPCAGPPATVLLPYDQLAQVVKNCGSGETIEVESSPSASIIRFPLGNETGESKVAFVAPDEFPQTPRLKAEAIPLPRNLRRSLLEAMDCASIDSTRYVLNGAFIDTGNPKANYIVGTDGKHLYSANSFALPLQALRHPAEPQVPRLEGVQSAMANGSSRPTGNMSSCPHDAGGSSANRSTAPIPTGGKRFPIRLRRKRSSRIDPAQLDPLIKLIQRMPCHDDRYHSLGLEWKAGQFLLLGKDTASEPWLRVPVPDVKANGPEINDLRQPQAAHQGPAVRAQHDQPHRSARAPALPQPGQADDRHAAASRRRSHATTRKPTTRTGQHASIPAPVSPPAPPATQTNDHESHLRRTHRPNGIANLPLEEALDLTLQIRDKFTDGFNLLRDLSTKLKAVHRDHKTSSREFNSVRSTLRSLQGLKL
jgi:hypothetical protein